MRNYSKNLTPFITHLNKKLDNKLPRRKQRGIRTATIVDAYAVSERFGRTQFNCFNNK